MPVSPIGNMNYINQNVGVRSHNVSTELAKESFASVANLAQFKEAQDKVDKKLERVSETHEIENRVEEKKEEEKQNKNSFFAKDEEKEEEENESSLAYENKEQRTGLDLRI